MRVVPKVADGDGDDKSNSVSERTLINGHGAVDATESSTMYVVGGCGSAQASRFAPFAAASSSDEYSSTTSSIFLSLPNCSSTLFPTTSLAE